MLTSSPLSPKCEMCFQEAGHKEGNPSSPHLHALEEQLSVDTRTTRDLKTQQVHPKIQFHKYAYMVVERLHTLLNFFSTKDDC